MSDSTKESIANCIAKNKQALESRGAISSIFNCKDNKKITYSNKSVLRKSELIRQVFDSLLDISGGDRIAVFSSFSEDFLALSYAAFSSNLAIILVDSSFSKAELVATLSSSNIKAVFFPHSASLVIANVIGSLKLIQHWIVCDWENNSKVPNLNTLKELIDKNDPQTVLKNCEIFEDEESLIFLDKTCLQFPIGCAFSQQQLINIAKTQLDLLNKIASKKHVGIFLSEHSIISFIYGVIAPLFQELNCTIFKNCDIDKFWDYVKIQNIEIAVVDFGFVMNINKRVKVEQLNLNTKMELLITSDAPIPLKEFQTLCTSLNCDLHTSLFRLEAGGLLSHCHHQASAVKKHEDLVCFGAPLAGIEFKIVDSLGAEIKGTLAGKLEIKSNQIMLSYGGSKPGNDLHIDPTILRTNAEALMLDNNGHAPELYFKNKQSSKNIISQIKSESLIQPSAADIAELEKSALNTNNSLNNKALSEDQLQTEYGKQCTEEILALAGHVMDAESLLRGALSTMVFHTVFERGLVVEVFDADKSYVVVANEGFNLLNDSTVKIESTQSIFLNAKGKLNSFSTRKSAGMPFETPNYAFSYLPSQRKGNLVIYLDLPNSEVLPFPERRIFRKGTAVLAALLQKFAFRYTS